MRGFGNNALMKRAGAKYVRDIHLNGFQVVDTHGGFPYMIQDDGGVAFGELWEFNNLAGAMPIVSMEEGAGYNTVVAPFGDTELMMFVADPAFIGDITKKWNGKRWNS